MRDVEGMVRRQRVLADFGEFALRNENLDEVLTEACRLVADALGTVRAKVLEVEEGGRTLLVRAGVGWGPGVVGHVRLEMTEHSSETFSIRAAVPVITRDIAQEDRFELPAFLRDARIVALVNVPVFLPGGRPYGLLQVDATEPRDFGPEDYEFLRTYATILGPVIDRLHKIRRLLTTEERLRRVVETEAVGVIFFDGAGTVVDANSVFLRMTGYTREDIASGTLTWRRMTPPEWVAASEAQVARCADTGRIGPYEKEYLLADGSRRWMLFAGRDLGDGTIAEHCIDVTDRVLAEAKLRESEERFRRFGDASLDVLWIRDAETLQWEYLTPAFERIYGMEVDQALRGDTMANWLDLILPEDRDRVLANIMRVRAGERVTFDYRIRRPLDGEIRSLRNTDFPLADEGGRVRRIGGAGHDITELKQVEEALREEEARQRALVEGISQLVWRSAGGGQWSWAGPQWCAFTGLSAEASLGLGWLDALHPGDRAAALDAWGRAEADGVLQVDCRIRHAGSGHYAWFQTRAIPVRDEAGRLAEWIGTCTNIDDQVQAREVLARGREELEALVAARTTELTAAEETLRQAQKMEAVGQLTGGIAHDFNNMLQGVAGGLEMARRRMEEGRTEEAGRYLEASRAAVGRAAGLTRRLLAFARRQRLEPRPLEADALVAGLADLIRRTVGPAIAVDIRLGDGHGSVLCDPNELESALLNLCINARDAMPEGGRLVIGTEELTLARDDIPNREAAPGRYVALSVADTGTGMPPEVMERVFEPFFTTKPQGQGTGLGLSQVWGFVRQSGGLVRIESASGAGTTVRLLLPLHDIAAAAEVRDEPPPPQPTSGATVLLVDDEAGVRRPAADRLRDLGHLVLEAQDGPEALRILARTRPDLLVTDVGLPNGMNGRQVAEAAREQQPGLPVLFITGYAGTALPPGVEVIGKPFELDTLVRRVGTLLESTPKASDRSPDA